MWLLKAPVLKYTIWIIIFDFILVLAVKLVDYISPYITTAALNNAFAAIPEGIWYFVDILALNFGLPAVITAYITRFLIRRIPVIG